MRTEPLTLEEAKMILKRSMTFTSGKTIILIQRDLELAEVPRGIANKAFDVLEQQGRTPTEFGLATEMVRLHNEFLETASLEDRQRCFLRKAVAYSDSVDNNRKWEEHFAAEIEKEFNVPGEIGEIAMRKTPSQLGVSWTDQVVEAALLNIRNWLENSSSPKL